MPKNGGKNSHSGRPRAVCLIKQSPYHPREIFHQGLAASGFDVVTKPEPPRSRDDILVIWNRIVLTDPLAREYEAKGNKVLVAENGYIGDEYYALSRGHHNGAGKYNISVPMRHISTYESLLKPWRKDGKHVLILPQRGIGLEGIGMPRKWPEEVSERLRGLTDRPLRLRRHPGNNPCPLEPDLADAWCAVTWGSGAGIKSIFAGIPVFYEFPQWIGGSAAKYGIEDIEDPYLGDRSRMAHHISYAQWHKYEIINGTAIMTALLEPPKENILYWDEQQIDAHPRRPRNKDLIKP